MNLPLLTWDETTRWALNSVPEEITGSREITDPEAYLGIIARIRDDRVDCVVWDFPYGNQAEATMSVQRHFEGSIPPIHRNFFIWTWTWSDLNQRCAHIFLFGDNGSPHIEDLRKALRGTP